VCDKSAELRYNTPVKRKNTMKNIDEINAKYNELCQAVDAVDWKLREFTKLYDPQIDNLYSKPKPCMTC